MKKKIGNGFGLRLTQFILYLLFLLLFVAYGIILFQDYHSNSFVDWLKCTQYNGSQNSDSKVDLDANGIYDDQCGFRFISYMSEQELIVGSGENIVTYNFTTEDMGSKEFICTNKETGEILTIEYSQIQVYEKFVSLGGWREKADVFVFSGLVGGALLFGLFALLQALATFLGKKSVKANNLSIVINSITVIFLGLGAFGLAGGIKGKKYLRLANLNGQGGTMSAGEQPSNELVQPQSGGVQTALVSERTELEKADSANHSAAVAEVDNTGKSLRDFPVDYENKPTVSKLFDENYKDHLILTAEDDVTTIEFNQLYVTLYKGAPYALCETIGLDDKDGGGLIVFSIDYENDLLHIEHDDAICEAVYEEYKRAVNGAQADETQKIKRSDFKLNLYDASIDEKTWKDFKKTATQNELAVIAIGAKYRIVHSRIKNIIYAIGIILSIALFWPTGGYSLIGYPVFAFLATKAIRYQDTYDQSYRKLSKENKEFVDGYYNGNIGLNILDIFIKLATFWITIPYQAILLLIGTFAPNFVISKNGILVSIPKGYDVGNLGAVGAYYSGFTFLDESMAALEEHRAEEEAKRKRDEEAASSSADNYYKETAYSYTDSHGYEQTIYTDKYGKEAHDAGGHYVGTISSDGDNRKFTPAGKSSEDNDE